MVVGTSDLSLDTAIGGESGAGFVAGTLAYQRGSSALLLAGQCAAPPIAISCAVDGHDMRYRLPKDCQDSLNDSGALSAAAGCFVG